jgi:NADPH-dependent 2,4-dienoyl-CoA reductase/sulfur reductase-like enzyme
VVSLPGAEDITFVLIIDKSSRKLLGAQMAGRTGVSKRIDIFATALAAGMTVDEIYMLDLSYSPSVATVPDAVNRICGKAIIAIDKTL